MTRSGSGRRGRVAGWLIWAVKKREVIAQMGGSKSMRRALTERHDPAVYLFAFVRARGTAVVPL